MCVAKLIYAKTVDESTTAPVLAAGSGLSFALMNRGVVRRVRVAFMEGDGRWGEEALTHA